MNKKYLLLFLLCFLLNACATVKVRGNSTEFDNSYYPAVQQDVKWTATDELHPVASALMILDFPFSIVTDTILLPYDAITME